VSGLARSDDLIAPIHALDLVRATQSRSTHRRRITASDRG